MALTIVVFLFYLAWGVISLVCQGEHGFKEKVKAKDLFGLIPNFKFFCPNPVRSDYHLYYRQGKDAGEWAEWEEIRVPERNLLFSFIWNPTKKERKTFSRAISVIKKYYKNKPGRNKGPIYQFFLHYILQQANLRPDQSIQFKITRKIDRDQQSPESVVFLSPAHATPVKS